VKAGSCSVCPRCSWRMRLGNDFVVYPLRLQVDLLLVHWHLTCYQYIVVHSKFPATSCWPLVDSNQVSTGSVHMDNKGKPHRSGSWMTSCLLCYILLEHIWSMISRCIHALKHLLQFYQNWKQIYIESGSSPPFSRSDIWEMRWYMTGAVIWIYGRLKTQCDICLPWNSHIQYEYADTN
jgi:hypothetical protein